MNRPNRIFAMVAFALLWVSCGVTFAESSGGQWPSFRGPGASGVSDGFPLPTEWDVPSGKNVKWKTPIPGLAHSSPIVWGDRIFVTTAISTDDKPYLKIGLYGESPDHPENVDHDFRVYCLDKKTGSILWEKSAYKGIPKVKRHVKATHANSTPATDGKHVVAFFGAEGIYCYDFEGNLKWKRDLGNFDAGPAGANDLQWGFASSPVIHDGKVIVQCDHRGPSFVAALDVTDGKDIWRTTRKDDPTWATPTVHVERGRSQVICNGYKHIGGYALATGKELWWMRGGGDVPVPAPIVAKNLIFITNAHGGDAPVYAIRTSAEGDISLAADQTENTHIAWSHMKIGNYMQTPVVYGDYLYCCRDQGIIACYDALTGKKQYRERLADGVGFTSSPAAGDGKVYFASEEGDVYVLKAGPSYEVVHKNALGQVCMASPAISNKMLIYRTQHQVVAIGE